MKTVFLLIFLWTFAYAHPVPNHLSAHPRSSTEQEDTASEEHMNELVGLDDGDDRSPHGSRERGEMDIVGDSEDQDPADENDFGDEVAKRNSGAKRSRIREAQHKNWVDHEDTGDLDEAEYQHENSLGQRLDEKHFLEEEDAHDADNGDKGEHYGAESRVSDSYKAGGNGLVYRPTGFFPRRGYRERSDLLDEEDDSGDDTFDENNEGEENGQDATYTIGPNGAGERDTFGDSDQNGDHRGTVVSGRQHDSSSSSSESRSLDRGEYRNYIASRYGGTYRRGGDSDSSSQEERYDFDNEEMQGDDPSVFDGFMGNSKGLRAAFHYKESSQESSREAGKAVLKVSDQSEEESRSKELPDGPDNSEEDDSLQHDDSESVDADSREDSQAAEDKSESEEHITSESKENSADRSEEDVESHSTESVDSKSREEPVSQSDEASRESQEENSREVLSKLDERSGSKSEEGQEDRESAEDNSKPSELDRESAEREGDQSESREKSKSSEDSVESEEDRTDSVADDDGPSRSKSTESQSTSHEGDSSEEDPTTDSHESEEVTDEDSTSTESRSSDSKEEEHSHSAEEDSHSREDATNESTSHGDDSLPRSLESEKRKRRLRVYHKQHIGDYDDNDCQDGY
ncbi:PREDICTED: dentin matrix acidic phosphoprotein 1 [Tinamus guttatus]|nr:PREDICTED: dentin matrix acidic phosphoprotein 1 [Tinamus guttatus]